MRKNQTFEVTVRRNLHRLGKTIIQAPTYLEAELLALKKLEATPEKFEWGEVSDDGDSADEVDDVSLHKEKK